MTLPGEGGGEGEGEGEGDGEGEGEGEGEGAADRDAVAREGLERLLSSQPASGRRVSDIGSFDEASRDRHSGCSRVDLSGLIAGFGFRLSVFCVVSIRAGDERFSVFGCRCCTCGFGVACLACVALRCPALPCVRLVCSFAVGNRDEFIVLRTSVPSTAVSGHMYYHIQVTYHQQAVYVS